MTNLGISWSIFNAKNQQKNKDRDICKNTYFGLISNQNWTFHEMQKLFTRGPVSVGAVGAAAPTVFSGS